MQVGEILETCIYTDDLDAARTFYRDVLGLEIVLHEPKRHIFFRCGGRFFLVFNPAETSDEGDVPSHGAAGSCHVAFAVPHAEMTQWRQRLEAHGVAIEMDYEWPQGGRSLYFRDPAGNSVELAAPAIWCVDEGQVFGAS